MTIVLQVIIVLFAVVFLARAINLIATMRWYERPRPPGTTVRVAGRRVYYTLKGEGQPTVVIEAALGTASPEWWMVQDELARATSVLTYDRGGYGWSGPVYGPRTTDTVAKELKQLLEELEIGGPLVLVGHSLGGLFVNRFCRMFPDLVAGVVLIDPMSPDDNRFERELVPNVYRRSGIDKRRALRIQSWLNGFGIPRLMRRIIQKSESFRPYYFLPKETIDVLWHHMLLPHTPRTASDEYSQARNHRANLDLKSPETFPQVPLGIVSHSSEKMGEQIARSVGLSSDEAWKIESLWQELIRAHCDLAPGSRLVIADRSGHSIHLEQRDLVVQTVLEVIQEVRRTHSDVP
ncbi:MAG: alpha/beta hydrolase [Ignavibacteria bacterium]|nr:alpha/beta hydrolase [Ignavibacteria bacterium]